MDRLGWLVESGAMTASEIVLLGGAGKTGRRIATLLRARGCASRFASRSSATSLDWHDEATWASALAGADTAYLAPPVDPDGLAAAARFVSGARGAGLRRLVLLSGRGVGRPDREFQVYDSSLALEQSLRGSGLDWTILQPAWFMQNFSEGDFAGYVLGGELRLSAGDGGEAWIDVDDVADVAVEALLDESHAGRRYPLSGPRVLSLHDIAAELTEATRRQITYVPLRPDEHVAEMIAFGVPASDAEAVRDLLAVISAHRSEYVSDGVEQVLGRKPRDFIDWARANAAEGMWPVSRAGS
jgi:uncharacterized protein YbjT (DUF2867 family)